MTPMKLVLLLVCVICLLECEAIHLKRHSHHKKHDNKLKKYEAALAAMEVTQKVRKAKVQSKHEREMAALKAQVADLQNQLKSRDQLDVAAKATAAAAQAKAAADLAVVADAKAAAQAKAQKAAQANARETARVAVQKQAAIAQHAAQQAEPPSPKSVEASEDIAVAQALALAKMNPAAADASNMSGAADASNMSGAADASNMSGAVDASNMSGAGATNLVEQGEESSLDHGMMPFVRQISNGDWEAAVPNFDDPSKPMIRKIFQDYGAARGWTAHSTGTASVLGFANNQELPVTEATIGQI